MQCFFTPAFGLIEFRVCGLGGFEETSSEGISFDGASWKFIQICT